MGANDDFVEELVTQAVIVDQFAEAVRRQVVGYLYQLAEDLEDQLHELKLTGREGLKRRRVVALLEQTQDTIERGYTSMGGALTQHLEDLGPVQAQAMVTIGEDIFTKSIFTTSLTPKDYKIIASETLIDGAPSREWWERQTQTTKLNFAREVRLGVGAGETNAEIVRRIRGSDTGARQVLTINGKRRVLPKFAGGVMDISTRQAEALVRTSVQTISSTVLDEVYRENKDIIQGVAAVVTLDARTTLICMGLSGGAWDLETGDPLPDSATEESYPGTPPYHWLCRTILAPVTKSWDQLLEEAGSPLRTKLRGIPKTTRASMDGQVPGKLTYEQWLKKKPVAFQQDVLGQGRWELWQSGKIKMNQLVSPSLKPRTLDELKALSKNRASTRSS